MWELQSQTECDVLTSALADPAFSHDQDWGPSSSSLQQLHSHASQLCGCITHLSGLLRLLDTRSDSVRWHELLLPVAVPALELSVLTIQHVSTCLELLPAHVPGPLQSLWRALYYARNTTNQIMWRSNTTCSCCAGLRQQLLQSPYHLPATSVALLVAVYGTLLCPDATAWWHAATSSSSSGGRSSQQQGQHAHEKLEEKWREAAWELACSRHDALPAAHYMLLQLACCSSQALLWAATEDYNSAEAELFEIGRLCHSAAYEHIMQQLDQGYCSTLVPETSAVFLWHAVLLHWAWHYWQEGDLADLALKLTRALSLRLLTASSTTFRTLVYKWALVEAQEQQQQQQQDHQGQQEQQQAPQGSRGGTPSGLFFPVPVYLQILDDMLLLVHKLLTLLLPIQQAAAMQQPAQAASSSNSSSPPGTSQASGSSSSSNSRQLVTSELHTSLASCLEELWVLYAVLSSDHVAAYANLEVPQQSLTASRADRVYCTDASVLRADSTVWFQHAVRMCEVLEAYVREAAHSQAAGRHSLLLGKTAAGLGAALVELIDPSEAGLRGPMLQAAVAAGPGSKEQQQLHGLLRSVLKWAGMMGPEQQPLAEQLRAAVAVAAANMLLAGSKAQEAAAAAAAAAASSTATADETASSSTAVGSRHSQDGITEQPALHSTAQHVQVAALPGSKAESATATSSGAAVLSQLPWLGVLGCCCLQWSQQLASLPTDNPAAAEAAAQSGVAHRAKGVITVLPEGLRSVWGTAVAAFTDEHSLICLCIDAANTWLKEEFTLQPELIVQWVAPPHLNELLTGVNGCLRACYDVRDILLGQPNAPIPLAAYVQQLSTLGVALCAVPHKQSCNNPTCGNVSGPSELHLVKGRSNTCSGCRTARYCSPECMRQHWKQHRPVCKALGRPAAAAAATAAAKTADEHPQASV
jgi:hypothetical protein